MSQILDSALDATRQADCIAWDRAERNRIDYYERRQAASEAARESVYNTLYEAIQKGDDVPIAHQRADGAIGRYMLHSYVGEVTTDPAQMLLAACSMACKDGSAETQPTRDRDAATLLRKFVEVICNTYADDNWSMHA